MDSESIQHFFKGKTILITGTTGFLAKVFMEKILRTQPEIQKLYLIVRAANTDLAVHRFQNEMIGTDLYRVLRDQFREDFDSFISRKVVVISGDVSLDNLGLKDKELEIKMLEEIDVIVNCAASTKFDERFDISMGVNTMGALNVLNFAKNCHRLKVLVHISTAYVCGEVKDGKTILLEKPFEMGQTPKGTSKLDINEEMNMLKKKIDELRSKKNADQNTIKQTVKDYGIERANLYGWPNTYVFTKAMGEMLVVHHKDNVPLIIIRPTIVTSTYKDPFPGWIEGLRTIDKIICGYGQGKITSFIGHSETILDTVVNLVNKVFCQCFQDVFEDNYKKVKRMIRLAELYKPYVFFRGVFDDTNTENLRKALKGLDMEIAGLDFDPNSIDWTDYLMNAHIPGLLKYVIN